MKVEHRGLGIIAEMEATYFCDGNNVYTGSVPCEEAPGYSYLVMLNGMLIDGWEKYKPSLNNQEVSNVI